MYRMTIENRMDLVRSFACEILMEEELAKLLQNKPNPTAYDGFEPSGRMHIAQVRSLTYALHLLAVRWTHGLRLGGFPGYCCTAPSNGGELLTHLA